MPAQKRAPVHLREETRKWWRQIAADYELQPHHVRVLTDACEMLDRAEGARERIEADGAYVVDRFEQLKAHPAIGVERQARLAFARLVRALDLEEHEPEPAYQQPTRRRNRRG